HVKWDRCPFSLQRLYTGGEVYPTIAHQATVDHSGRILAVPVGFFGVMNDTTIIRCKAAIPNTR
ncbi:unnamed protein product, partial [Sphacelaria rigidula]